LCIDFIQKDTTHGNQKILKKIILNKCQEEFKNITKLKKLNEENKGYKTKKEE
jgi:hypothetical protein